MALRATAARNRKKTLGSINGHKISIRTSARALSPTANPYQRRRAQVESRRRVRVGRARSVSLGWRVSCAHQLSKEHPRWEPIQRSAWKGYSQKLRHPMQQWHHDRRWKGLTRLSSRVGERRSRAYALHDHVPHPRGERKRAGKERYPSSDRPVDHGRPPAGGRLLRRRRWCQGRAHRRRHARGIPDPTLGRTPHARAWGGNRGASRDGAGGLGQGDPGVRASGPEVRLESTTRKTRRGEGEKCQKRRTRRPSYDAGSRRSTSATLRAKRTSWLQATWPTSRPLKDPWTWRDWRPGEGSPPPSWKRSPTFGSP